MNRLETMFSCSYGNHTCFWLSSRAWQGSQQAIMVLQILLTTRVLSRQSEASHHVLFTFQTRYAAGKEHWHCSTSWQNGEWKGLTGIGIDYS
jgi:hypothetical protein